MGDAHVAGSIDKPDHPVAVGQARGVGVWHVCERHRRRSADDRFRSPARFPDRVGVAQVAVRYLHAQVAEPVNLRRIGRHADQSPHLLALAGQEAADFAANHSRRPNHQNHHTLLDPAQSRGEEAQCARRAFEVALRSGSSLCIGRDEVPREGTYAREHITQTQQTQ